MFSYEMAESLKKMKKKKNKFKKNVGEANVKERKPKEFVKPVDMVNDGKKNKVNGLNRPLVKHHEGQKWYSYQTNETISDPMKDTLATADLLALEEEADACLKADVELYNQHVRTQGGSEAAWLLSVIKKGTASDRMTAMQLQMHTSPVHSLCYIEIMISSLEKKNTRESLEILPILEEIFLNHFLPPDRKLIPFSGRPLKRIGEICSNSKDGRRRLLVLWRFEHKLKLVYERYLRAVEGLASLVVEDLSKRALRTALNLLAERPEGERFLLSMLVNKLGHPKTHIAAFVATLLEDLTKRQPRMRSVIVAEVERLIYRINVSPKAHMYASTFLSQITLRAEDSALAVQMLSIYFGLFKTLVCRKVPDNRLLVILLSAANRALPFAKEKADSLVEDINTLYKVVHTSSYSVALQTLKLLFQVHQISDSLSDRFYTALYRKLLIEVPPSCYNQMLLLVFKVLKADPSENRVRTFVKRLLQAATSATPSLAAGILILISRLLEARKNLIVLQKQVDRVALVDAKLRTTGDDDDEERYFDLGPDGKPITAVKKEEVIFDYLIVHEVQRSSLKSRSFYLMPFHVEDEIQVEDANGVADEKKVDGVNGVNFVSKPGWIHRKHASKSATSPYNHGVRNPLFVDCSNLVDSELLLLSKHYHPSVAIFAKALIQDGCINYKGDPIEDFTLLKFLDRFAFKNPKENRSKDSSTTRVLRKKQFDPWGVKKLPVSSKEYISKKPSELPADEHYLHRFASLKFHPQEKEKKEEDDWEIESVDSAEFDAIIDKFEPGEANEEFDVDYTKEFTSEKKKPRAVKRAAEEEDGEDDEVDFELDDDEEDEGGEDDEEDDEDMEDDDDEVEMESDSDDAEAGGRETKKNKADFGDSDDSDDEMVGNDANAAGEKFAALLEDFEEEETSAGKKGKRKWKKSKALKRKRN